MQSTSSTRTESLDLEVKGTISKFVRAIATGEANEIACFGPRGERKTNGFLVGAIEHARKHAESGYELPVKWMSVTDTFQAHKDKTIESMRLPHWKGAWEFSDDNHIAHFVFQNSELVRINLFGIEDQGAMDRVRRECHCVWFEEPAPVAVLIQSSGINETAWLTALTSRRLPTHAHVSVMTLNYPDEDHWTWQRFIADPQQGTQAFRIPPGENASPKDRAEWARALAGRPDLLRRLLAGEPGTVALGPQVAMGFREDLHISSSRLSVVKGEPLILGWDGGHTPTCIIGQHISGTVRVLASLYAENCGMRQLIGAHVRPWLARKAKWELDRPDLLLHGGDPTLDTGEQADIDQSPVRVINQMLGGQWIPGAVDWQSRIGPVLALLICHSAVVIDPVDAKPLIQALSGRWYYPQDRNGKVSRDLPKKPNHPWEDLGDAFCYFIGRIAPGEPKVKLERMKPKQALSYVVR